MKRLSILLIAIVASLLPHNLWAQAHYSIDTNQIVIGDQFTLTIGSSSIYPTLQDLSQGSLVAVEQHFDTIQGDVQQHTSITSFDTGSHWLHLSASDSLLIIVNDVEGVDTASLDIKDIAPIIKEPYTFWEIFRWVLLGLAVIAIVLGVMWAISRWRNHEPLVVLSKTPPEPPHTIALRKLEHLRQRQLWQQGKIKEYHTELTDIVRAYIENAYRVQSSEMTSAETIEAFSATSGATPESIDHLRSLLQTADMVKFAKSEPMPYEHDRSMTDATQFVQITAPKSPSDDAAPTNTMA